MASQSHYKRVSLGTTPTDANQKEILSSQLKAEIIELKQNEREYLELSNQLRRLEQRYSLLQEEKAKGESEFKGRNGSNFDTIANLRTDVDTLKATIADTKLELQDLRAENVTVKDFVDQRNNELQRLKLEVTQASDQNNALDDSKKRLEAELEITREEKRRLVALLKETRESLNELSYRIADLEKNMKDTEYNNGRLSKQNNQLDQAIDDMSAELKSRTTNLEVVEQQVSNSQKEIQILEKEMQEGQRDNERNRAEGLQKQKVYQQEVTKNLDLTARLAVLENTLRAKDTDLEELKRGYDNLKNAHSNLLDTNFQLKQELDTVKVDIEGISGQNSDLVIELDRLALEDDQVRAILNRSDRVESLKYKSENQLKKSSLKPRANRLSPSPDRNGSRASMKKSPLKESIAARGSPSKY